MEHTGIKINKELEQLIKEVIRVQLGAELTLTQLSALCMTDKVNMIHTGEYLNQLSVVKRIHAQKWIELLAVRGGQFRTEGIEIIVPVPCKEQLGNEQGKQLKIVLDLAMCVEKRVTELVKKLHYVARMQHDSVVVEMVEAKNLPKQMEIIRQLEAQLQTLCKQDVPEYLFEKLTIKPLVENIKQRVHRQLAMQLMTPFGQQQQQHQQMGLTGPIGQPIYQAELLFPVKRMF
ncbi:hypothetical protein Ciccas_008148 [Cichlidogyrus casuarinus]|uniref:Ferritin n=1 Tax=Cichlidogyrus casuarinus TaxID=1844966 RepID=A0ABD2Q0X0_9PLAT